MLLTFYILFLSVDETEKYLGSSAYVPSASSNGKFKLRASASPFVSSAVGEKVQCEGTELSIPKVDRERKPKVKRNRLVFTLCEKFISFIILSV